MINSPAAATPLRPLSAIRWSFLGNPVLVNETDGWNNRPPNAECETRTQRRSQMLAFLGKRLFSLIFTMLAVSVLVFAAFEFTPGQVARKVLGPFATQDQVDQLTEK